jgi:hypothetical protein
MAWVYLEPGKKPSGHFPTRDAAVLAAVSHATRDYVPHNPNAQMILPSTAEIIWKRLKSAGSAVYEVNT